MVPYVCIAYPQAPRLRRGGRVALHCIMIGIDWRQDLFEAPAEQNGDGHPPPIGDSAIHLGFAAVYGSKIPVKSFAFPMLRIFSGIFVGE